RYLPGNVVHAINTSDGRPVAVDEETARLLDCASKLHEISEGLFDITSGALRRAWTFDGSDRIPDSGTIMDALEHVGWHRVAWNGSEIRLEPGMEIDLGGIGKEYAVDRAARLAESEASCSILVNFGGDLVVTKMRDKGRPWRVGIEDPASAATRAKKLIGLTAGGLATSGDARRYLLRDGVRYGHILDARTGWPVTGAPRSVTVAAGSCVQAGMLATLAMLRGREAESFLEAQEARCWICR
ncbi:MAG TPA: FAD:protein FMN transferase, partial [Candidatus Saccharimonadales bacterium]|nr:FAD:protein FMN transferase [Candidatus Saccharimonadales bacterium]